VVGISDYGERSPRCREGAEWRAARCPLISFTHNPDIFPQIPTGLDLTLAGREPLEKGLRYGSVLAALALSQKGDMITTSSAGVEALLDSEAGGIRR